MGTSKLQEAARLQCANILKAWCLLVEHGAKPLNTLEIEKQLTYSKSEDDYPDLRQWDRWKKGQLPSALEFVTMNNLALDEKRKWILPDLSDALVQAYKDRSGKDLRDVDLEGWGQLIALSRCQQFAQDNDVEELLSHCQKWQADMDAPEGENNETKSYILQTQKLSQIINNRNVEEHVDVLLWRMIYLTYEAGIEDPISLIKERIKHAATKWPENKKLFDDDRVKMAAKGITPRRLPY